MLFLAHAVSFVQSFVPFHLKTSTFIKRPFLDQLQTKIQSVTDQFFFERKIITRNTHAIYHHRLNRLPRRIITILYLQCVISHGNYEIALKGLVPSNF